MKAAIRISFFIYLFSICLCSIAKAEVEPNNSFASANIISANSHTTGTIDPQSDKDYFKFNIPKAGTLQAELSNVPNNLNLELKFYNESFDFIGEAFSSAGQNVYFNKILCDPGDYYVLVTKRSASSQSSNQQYALNMVLIINDIHECNNDFNQAAEFEIGEEIKASIGAGNDKDYFKFYCSQSGTLHLKVLNIPAVVTPELTLFDNNGNKIAQAIEVVGDSMGITKIICAGREYYILLENRTFYNGFSQDLYTLETTLDTGDPFECNNSFETAAHIGIAEYTATLGDTNDRDYYYFILPQSGTFRFELFSFPASFSPEVILYGKNQNEISKIVQTGDADSIAIRRLICSDNDTFFVLIQNQSLTKRASDTPYHFRLVLNSEDQYECNNDFENAKPIPLDTEIRASLSYADDEDFFIINTEDHNTVTVSWYDIPSPLRPLVRVYNSDRNLVDSQGGTAENGVTISFTSCVQDDYYIRLTQNVFSSGFSDSLYKMKVLSYNVPPDYENNDCPNYDDEFNKTENDLKLSGATLRHDYHIYNIENTICEIGSGPDCNVEKAWSLLKSKRYFMAPSSYDFLKPLLNEPPYRQGLPVFDLLNAEEGLRLPVNSCKEIELFGASHLAVDLGLISGIDQLNYLGNGFSFITSNPIAFYVNEEKKCITNYTLPGHALYPGKITRCITGECDEVKVQTTGEGLHFLGDNIFGGIMSKINSGIGTLLFNSVDERFINAFNNGSEVIYDPPVIPNRVNLLEGKEWQIRNLSLIYPDGSMHTAFDISNDSDMSYLRKLRFELKENNIISGTNVLGNDKIGSWWIRGDSISIGHEISKLTYESEDLFVAEGQMPVYWNEDILFVDYIMSFVSSITGTENSDLDEEAFSIFPNPVTDILNLKWNKFMAGKFQSEIINVMGQRIQVVDTENQLSDSEFILSLNVKNLKEGIYYLRFASDTKSGILPFIKN